MATLKQLLADRTASSTLDFRNNAEVSSDGTLWSYAWVQGKDGKLLCIGATLATLEALEADPNLATLMLTKPQAKVAEKTGLQYEMSQLFIGITIEFHDENKLISIEQEKETQAIISSNEKSIKMNDLIQKLTKSMFLGLIIAVLLGYFFSTEIYFKGGNEISYYTYINSYNKNQIIIKEVFNIKLAALTFVLVSGFMVFVYYNEHKKTYFKVKINSWIEKFAFKKSNPHKSLHKIKNDLVYILKNTLFNFNGRISRSEFFGRIMSLNLISYIFIEPIKNESSMFLQLLLLIIYMYVLINIHVKRLHDINFSGWYCVFYFTPLALYFLCFITKYEFLIGLIMSAWNLIFGINIISNLILLFISGNSYKNRYGEKS
jgi:uncharacterized membrane protein YhaH (DUF805 family)